MSQQFWLIEMADLEETKRISMKSGLLRENGPEWHRMKYIKSGYRLGGTYFECLLSLFWLHNESMNAWTMIAGIFTSTLLLYNTWHYLLINNIELMDKIIFILFGLHGWIHLPFSVGYHLFGCMNRETFYRWRGYDMSMILIAGNILTFVLSYYVYNIYFTIILTLATSIFVFYAVNDIITSNKLGKFPKIRALKYTGIVVISYTSPIIYQTIMDIITYDNGLNSIVVQCFIFILVGLSIGALTFAFNFPEILFNSGTFDLFFNGHNIMHFGVIMAHIAEFVFILHMYSRWNDIKIFDFIVLKPFIYEYN